MCSYRTLQKKQQCRCLCPYTLTLGFIAPEGLPPPPSCLMLGSCGIDVSVIVRDQGDPRIIRRHRPSQLSPLWFAGIVVTGCVRSCCPSFAQHIIVATQCALEDGLSAEHHYLCHCTNIRVANWRQVGPSPVPLRC